MTANDIITTLQNNSHWINQAALAFRPNKYNRPYETLQTKWFTEVTMRIPTTKIAKRSGKAYQALQRRRIDLVGLIRPNYKAYDLMLVGVEIKVNLHDLRNDMKMWSYQPYFHHSYLAVPAGLEEEARTKMDPLYPNGGFYGILICDNNRVSVISTPDIFTPSDNRLANMFSELHLKQFK